MSIDFSKAPEGATHYVAAHGVLHWYLSAGDCVWAQERGVWVRSYVRPHGAPLTPIPTVAQPTGSTATEEQLEWARGVLSEFEHLTGAEKACAIAQHIIGLQIDTQQTGSTHDPVNSPSHYATGGVECIDAIKASMSHEAFLGFLKGNVQKYLWRYEKKANPGEDLKKAQWYLARLTKEEEGA